MLESVYWSGPGDSYKLSPPRNLRAVNPRRRHTHHQKLQELPEVLADVAPRVTIDMSKRDGQTHVAVYLPTSDIYGTAEW